MFCSYVSWVDRLLSSAVAKYIILNLGIINCNELSNAFALLTKFALYYALALYTKFA